MSTTDPELTGEIFDALDSGLVLMGPDARVAAWNSWMVAATGVTAEAARGRTLAEIFPDRSLGRLPSAIRDALDLGASSVLTLILHTT